MWIVSRLRGNDNVIASNSRRPVFPVLACGFKKLFRTFLRINWTNRRNGGLSGDRDAVLPPEQLNSPRVGRVRIYFARCVKKRKQG
jgi:hypothetical protein